MIKALLNSKLSHGGHKKPGNVRNIVGISSGKGGVGKTTIALQCAMALQQRGIKVGIVDADIYGPNIMTFMPEVHEKTNTLDPVFFQGIPCASMANIVSAEQALMWRGPMIGKAAMQLVLDTPWPELDVLLVDFPPGTGDVHLTLLKELSWIGYILVTTPHIMSQAESLRVNALFTHYAVPEIASVVNLHHVDCPRCGYSIPWLGESSQGLVVKYHEPWTRGIMSQGKNDYDWVTHIMSIIDALPEEPVEKRKIVNIPIKELQ